MLADGNDIVANDSFDGCGREFADKGSEQVVPEGHSRERPEGVEHDGREIRNEPGQQHDAVPFSSLDLCDHFHFGMSFDQAERRFPENGAEQDEADRNAHGFGHPGEKNAWDEAENESVGSGKQNGWGKSDGVHKSGEEECKIPGFVAKR